MLLLLYQEKKAKIYFLDLNRDFATAAVVLVGILEASHAELFYEIYWAKVVSGMVHKKVWQW